MFMDASLSQLSKISGSAADYNDGYAVTTSYYSAIEFSAPQNANPIDAPLRIGLTSDANDDHGLRMGSRSGWGRWNLV